jgi:hypothetical protein
MYSLLLILHSGLRWAVLLLGILAVVRSMGARSSGRWDATDDRSMLFFAIATDIQTLLGLILYVGISPVTALAFQNLGAAMRQPSLRFFVVEHAIGMLVAVALVHVGRVRVRKAKGADKSRRALMFTVLALIAMLLSIPWPGMPGGRPLLRF